MDRVNQLRQARLSPHVSFTEYIKLRSKSRGLIFVFEGRQCPAAYISWLQPLLRNCFDSGGQIIARGKKNVLLLRDLILKNPQTACDKNLYFVDRDYDVEPKKGSFADVWVTPGYSIENELINWGVIESFIRAYFDIADGEDHEALEFAKDKFQAVFETYIEKTQELNRVVYLCCTKRVDCYLGDSVLAYIQVNWGVGTIQRLYNSIDNLLEILKVESSDRRIISSALEEADDFCALDPLLDWRGKFHFSLVRSFLIYLGDARKAGPPPFKRASKLTADPSHPSLMGLLGSMSTRPACLTSFFEDFAKSSGAALAN